jgi:hypothetical protein
VVETLGRAIWLCQLGINTPSEMRKFLLAKKLTLKIFFLFSPHAYSSSSPAHHSSFLQSDDRNIVPRSDLQFSLGLTDILVR